MCRRREDARQKTSAISRGCNDIPRSFLNSRKITVTHSLLSVRDYDIYSSCAVLSNLCFHSIGHCIYHTTVCSNIYTIVELSSPG